MLNTCIYLLLYILYVIFGDHIFTKLLFNEHIKFPPDLNEIIKRVFFITYLSLLAISYFFYNPNINSWTIALILSMTSLISFIFFRPLPKIMKLPPDGNYYLSGIITHILLMIPLLYYFNFNFYNLDLRYLLLLVFFLFIYYNFIDILYKY